MDRLADGADRLCKRIHVMTAWYIAGLEVYFGDSSIIPRDEAIEDFGQETAFFLSEASGDAHVDGDDSAVTVNEEIAGMHVGVEKTITQGMAQK